MTSNNGSHGLSTYEGINKLEQESNIKTDSHLSLSDSRILVINSEPIFKIYCYEKDSFYEIFFENVKKLLKFQFSNSLNELLIVYEARDEMKIYFALIKISQNAIKQII